MLEGVKNLCYAFRMDTPRRLVTRACAVCDWTAATIETVDPPVNCPVCHAPTVIDREEVLYDAAAMRAQAAAFGRAGGLKGGRARAERLSPARRREIARKAAAARWRHK
jgi:hypothetical protein